MYDTSFDYVAHVEPLIYKFFYYPSNDAMLRSDEGKENINEV